MLRKEEKIERGCGYRQVGGLYLVCDAMGFSCDRLPFELEGCPCCGGQWRFSRGIIKTNAWLIFKENHSICIDTSPSLCPVCKPSDKIAGLMWVGENNYTPKSFIEEAAKYGVSKRIARIPEFIQLGKTWIFLAHRKAMDNKKPGIFMAFIPQRIEKIAKESEATPEFIEKWEKKGVDICTVPDNDTAFTKPKKKEKKTGLEGFGKLQIK
jgi:hypothetical protein